MKLWIAREKNNSLFIDYFKPELWENCSWRGSGLQFWLDPEMFPEITFENSPQQVELKLSNYEK